MKPLSVSVKRCAGPAPSKVEKFYGRVLRVNDPAEKEPCRTCLRWLHGLQVKPIATGSDEEVKRTTVEWMQPPSTFPCDRRLPA